MAKQAKSEPVKKSKHSVDNDFPFIKRWAVLIIGIFAFLLYANTLNHGFVLDDLSTVTDNRLVQLGVQGIPDILTHSYRFGYNNSEEGLYRPLSLVVFALEKQIGGYGPFSGHLVNVLLYCLCCIMVFLVLKQLFHTKSVLVPFITTLLFTCFPLHTEVVANIKSCDEILVLLGFLVSVFFLFKYLEKENILFLIGSIIGYLMGLFSKESAVSLVLIFPLVLYFFRELKTGKLIALSSIFAGCAALFLFIYFRIITAPETEGAMLVIQNSLSAATSTSERVSSAIANFGYYFRLLIFPYPMQFNYSNSFFPLVSWTSWKTLLSLLILISLAVYAILNFRKKNIFSFSILFFLITMAIVSNIFFLIRWTLGERFLFTPSFAFSIATASFLFYLFKIKTSVKEYHVPPGGNRIWIAIFVLLIMYSEFTVSRNADWKDNFTLFSRDVLKAPEVASTHALLGKALYEQAEKEKSPPKLEESIKQFKEAIDLYPEKDFFNELGIDYTLKGDFESAKPQFEVSIKMGNTRAEVFHNLGIAEFGLKHNEAARSAYLSAIKSDSTYIKSIINLSNLYYEDSMYSKAVEYGRKALSLDPSNEMIRNNLGVYFRDIGMRDSAAFYIQKTE